MQDFIEIIIPETFATVRKGMLFILLPFQGLTAYVLGIQLTGYRHGDIRIRTVVSDPGYRETGRRCSSLEGALPSAAWKNFPFIIWKIPLKNVWIGLSKLFLKIILMP